MRTAEARRIVAAHRQHIANLKATGGNKLQAEQMLSTYESSLNTLRNPRLHSASDTLTKSP